MEGEMERQKERKREREEGKLVHFANMALKQYRVSQTGQQLGPQCCPVQTQLWVQDSRTSDQCTTNWTSHDVLFRFDLFSKVTHRTQGNTILHGAINKTLKNTDKEIHRSSPENISNTGVSTFSACQTVYDLLPASLCMFCFKKLSKFCPSGCL